MSANDLLLEVDAFLAETGMGETYFGLCAARNPHLVARLRGGGRVWPETAQRVRDFISNHPHVSAAPADQPSGARNSREDHGDA